MLKGNAAGPAPLNELISPAPLLLTCTERAARADCQFITGPTKCPGRLHQRGWTLQKSWSLAWTVWRQAASRRYDCKPRPRWNVDSDYKPSIWLS
jgi:hypothetical protein